MKTFLAFLLVIVGLASYMVLALAFGFFQHYPVVHYLLALGGIAWLVALLRQRFTWLRVVALSFGALMTAAFFYWTLVGSAYEEREHKAAAGEVLAELPSLELPNAAGVPTRLFTGKERATLLVFYRGFWCPFCQQELVQLQRSLAEFEKRNIRVVAISVDQPEKLLVMKNAAGAGFEFVSDPEGRLLDRLDVRHVGGTPEGGDTAQSASFLIAPDGRILWRKLAANYRVRPEPKEVLAAIDALPPA